MSQGSPSKTVEEDDVKEEKVIDKIEESSIQSEKNEPNMVKEEKSEGVEPGDSEDLKNDPFAYLDRNGFTSEKFKIEIRNLPKYYGLRELRKLLNNKLNLGSNKVKVPSKGSIWAYICFRNEEDKNKAIEILNGYKWKGNILKAESAKAVPDPLVKKRMQDFDGLHEHKKIKTEGVSESEMLKDSTTPLWRLSYSDQLLKKEANILEVLKKLRFKLLEVNPDLKDWLTSQAEKYNGLPCELLPIRHADLPADGYRNKCEFSIGINESTGEKTIGFRLGSYARGSVSVAPIDDIPNVPKRMKEAVSLFEKFVRSSPLDVFNPETHQGHWCQLTSRYGFKTDQLMLIIGVNRQSLSESEISELKKDIKNFFQEGEGKSCQVQSLFIQYVERRKTQQDQPVLELIFGETFIREKLLNRSFRISPQAFFQINTNAAEVLYNSIAEISGLTSDSSLLDICCGTGSIGICLSDKCAEVLGLEISSEAIADAEENALANNVKNAQFFVGKAEEILSSVAHRASKPEAVAIVDPPRAGLHHKALVQLRKTKQINKLVYVSCEPRLALKNFIDLGRASSKTYQREPFVPIKAVPVDLFPFTNHCELLIYFERKAEES